MKVIVQKFGGTSLQDKRARLLALEKIENVKKLGFMPIVVVSAVGRKGDAYSTDTLIGEAEKCFEELEDREKDLLTSCGEVISAVLMVQMLRSKNIKSVALTGFQAGIVTDKNFGNAKVKVVDTKKIISYLEKGIVPVVAGYQGISEEFEITTLGRGGSDTTASILASALKAEKIEIYSDVQGLMTADPFVVSSAKLLDNISYEEVVELAYKGAKIIHPIAVEIAQQADIPLHILSNFEKSLGTLVHNIKNDKPVTGVTYNLDIIWFKINNIGSSALLLKVLAAKEISLDMIDVQPNLLSFLVNISDSYKLQDYLESEQYNFEKIENLCKISVVGSGMSGVPGVIANIVEALHSDGIEIYKSMDSHTAISVLVQSENSDESVKILHEKFNLEKSRK